MQHSYCKQGMQVLFGSFWAKTGIPVCWPLEKIWVFYLTYKWVILTLHGNPL